jgi:hypothetical protein
MLLDASPSRPDFERPRALANGGRRLQCDAYGSQTYGALPRASGLAGGVFLGRQFTECGWRLPIINSTVTLQ